MLCTVRVGWFYMLHGVQAGLCGTLYNLQVSMCHALYSKGWHVSYFVQ